MEVTIHKVVSEKLVGTHKVFALIESRGRCRLDSIEVKGQTSSAKAHAQCIQLSTGERFKATLSQDMKVHVLNYKAA